MKESIDPNDLEKFRIPANLLERLYDFTGSSADQTKGFLLAYTDQDGHPMVLCKAGSPIIDMGIRKALEKYLIEIENADMGYDVDKDKE